MVCEGDQKQGESASETSSVSANEVPSNQSGKNILFLTVGIKLSSEKCQL